ncbi:retrovirus-related pol polyprotein from transposon TNT 1-94 [Tanacetum coccineum]|uniref:Retrovirus-related pol polyprotein from transposon TNT 1-94 n=1 Tax=Tanacetum coccineum TaxID=301880 RepID=A0ABQ5ERD8_9ASTR
MFNRMSRVYTSAIQIQSVPHQVSMFHPQASQVIYPQPSMISSSHFNFSTIIAVVLDFINNVNARNKSKPVNKSSKRKVWKPTGKVFTNIRYIWRPTGRTFTIVGNACPLTRITTTTEVPLRKPTALENETPTHIVTLVYSRKPRKSLTNVPVSKPKVIKSVSANKKEPSKSWGSIVSDVPSSSLDECRSSKLFSVKLGNDHVAKILGYGDYQIRNVTILKVYYVEGLRHNLFSVGQFCDSNLEVAFRQHTCFIRNLEGLNKLIFEKEHLCSTCAMGKNKKKPHKPKSEDTNQEELYLLHMDLCGPMRVASVNGKKYILVIVDDYSRFTWVKCLRRIIETIHVYFDELTAMASEHSSSGPALHEMTHATISLGLMPNPPPLTPFVPPSRSDWDLFFQPLFDELLTPPPSVDYPAPEVVAPIHEVVAPVPAVSTSSPSLTDGDQDAPSPSNSQTTLETQPPVILNDFEEDNHDIEVAHMGNDPYFGIPILEVHSDQSLSSDIIYTIMHPGHQIFEHNSKWTKDHPLENIIGEFDRPVSTRLQLHEQALFCYYDAFLTVVEPKTYKDSLI